MQGADCRGNRWDKAVYDKAEEANERERERLGPEAGMQPRADGETVRAQARRLLGGKERWRPMWVDYGPPREVEVGMEGEGEGVGEGVVGVGRGKV